MSGPARDCCAALLSRSCCIIAKRSGRCPLYPEAPREALALLGVSLEVPQPDTLRAGLAAFALIPAFILWRATKAPSSKLTFLTCMIAAMTASNALVPHILLGGCDGRLRTGASIRDPADPADRHANPCRSAAGALAFRGPSAIRNSARHRAASRGPYRFLGARRADRYGYVKASLRRRVRIVPIHSLRAPDRCLLRGLYREK